MAEKSKSCALDEALFDSVIELIKSYIVKYRDRTSRVVEFKTPAEVRRFIDFTIVNNGSSKQEILALCENVLTLSVHTCHPRFYNTLFTSYEDVALLGAFLSTASNVNVYTYDMAPVFTLIENEVLAKVRSVIGWNEPGDGLFVPGGSIANLYGLLLARYQRFPESKTKGSYGLPQLAFFCSEQSHYSVAKSAIVMGVGMENVVKIKCDIRGRMIANELDSEITKAVSKGIVPVAVVATAGTTVLGAIDPLEEIACVAEKHKVWLHVDAAIAGTLLFSSKYRHRLAGIERMDSVAWNPHKSLGVPLQCSVFVTKHERLLFESNSCGAGYLFQKDKVGYDPSVDIGDKSIQCGRLSDSFKLWLLWKYEGMEAVEKRINTCIEINLYLRDAVKKRPRFYLLVEEPDSTNLCFWYLPPCLPDIELSLGNIPTDIVSRLNKIGPLIKSKMVNKGSMMIAYQPLPGGVPNCLRMVNINPDSTMEDMDFILNEIETLGCDITV